MASLESSFLKCSVMQANPRLPTSPKTASLLGKCRLANFKGLHDIVDARFLVPSLAKQSNCGIYDLLTETCLLAFPEAERFFTARSIAPQLGSVQLRSKAPSCCGA